MPTINQLVRKNRKQQHSSTKTPVLEGCSQKRGVCLLVRTMQPKKPNSALRRITRVRLSNNKEVTVDTGISLDSLPYILIVAVILAASVVMVVSKRRSEV